MTKLAVRPKIDLAFKKIFTENQDLLKALLSAVLNIPTSDIEQLTLENTEILPQDINNKFCRLDLKVKIKGRIIDVEMQLNNQGNFQNRALYYWSRLFSQSLENGKDYSLLPETIVISFIDFDLFGCSDYHSRFVLKEISRNEILTDKLSLYFFELTKIPLSIDKNKEIELWLKLIGAETYEELNELEKAENQDIQTALEYVKKLNTDERFRRQIEIREQTLLEETSAINYAKSEGKIEGRQEIINAMKKRGLSEKEIEAILDLTAAE